MYERLALDSVSLIGLLGTDLASQFPADDAAERLTFQTESGIMQASAGARPASRTRTRGAPAIFPPWLPTRFAKDTCRCILIP